MAFKCLLAIDLLCAVLLTLGSMNICNASTVYVKPDHYHIHCPGEPCYSLRYYEEHLLQYFVSNTTVVFLSGTHYMKGLQPLVIQNVDNFTLLGSSKFIHASEDILESSSRIEGVDGHQSGFSFTNVTGVHIENLTFINCGQKVYGAVRAALSFDEAHNVVLSRVTVCNSSGFGLHADRMFGNVQVYKSAFSYNTGNKEYNGGNAHFWYGQCPENHTTYLQIESSYFLHGNNTFKKHRYFYYYPSATGLTLLISCPAITVNINNITVSGNKAENGGNLAIKFTYFTGSYYDGRVPSIVINNSRIACGAAHRGGGLRVWSIVALASKVKVNDSCQHCILYISNTQFVSNHAQAAGGALYISHYQTKHIDSTTRQISFENCTFNGNTVSLSGKGAAVEIIKIKILGFVSFVSSHLKLMFQNCSFYNNSFLQNKNGTFIGATVSIYSMERVTFKNCNFTKNKNTAISLLDSNLILEGVILFEGNHAIKGGALRFGETALMYVRNNTHVVFHNNHAIEAGGAIYAQQHYLESTPSCFFQPVAPDFTYISNLKPWMSLTFDNNTAHYAGDGLYGGTVDYCYTYLHFKNYWNHSSYHYSSDIFNTIFDFTQQPGISNISSDPYGVCLCDESGHRNCFIKSYLFPRNIYPGEMFNISAAAVGQRSGVAPATIIATVTRSHNISQPIKQYLNASNRCVTLTYVLHSEHKDETLKFTVKQSDPGTFYHYTQYSYPTVTVSLISPCPWGRTLQHNPPYCDCDPLLVRHIILCNINHETIQRVAPVWIGYCNITRNGNTSAHATTRCANADNDQCTSQAVIVHSPCPYDYCVLKNINISLNTMDKQCAFNRTGILCGECPDGLSLVLGSSKCLHCSDLYLLLIIAFAVAGLLLVIFLIVCNLTVSEGMINGLVFYANIVHINRSIYFPSTETNPLAVFIAWLNLDLGIETCFYNGMNAYAKAWLQFAFPVYIWLIAGLIIILSRKYRIATRLSGRNAVKVLATLFLLSFAKLGRAIITVLTYTSVHYPDKIQVSVWLPDANVRYLQGVHIPLFITAVGFLALVFCFILVLTFIQCLQIKSNTLPLLWVNKLKPLFDAYTGPFKDRYRFWPGFLLLLLSILFILFALNDLDEPSIKLVNTTIGCFLVITLAWTFHGVYRKRSLNIIESSSVLNLGLLSVITNYILNHSNSQNNQTAVISVSAGLTFAMFIIVTCYQGCKQVTTSLFWQKCSFLLSKRRSERQQALEEPVTNALTPDFGPQQASNMTNQLLPVVRFDQYREPLLEYQNDNS